MPLVSSLSRAKVYTRWNETFPNELANEVEVVVADQPRIGNLKWVLKFWFAELNFSIWSEFVFFWTIFMLLVSILLP